MRFRLLLLACCSPIVFAQEAAGPGAPAAGVARPATPPGSEARFANDQLARTIDHLTWRFALSDIAQVDEVTYTSLPPARIPNPTGQGAGNPLIITALTFIPKNLD